MALYNLEVENAWLLDSAATHHVCKHREYFRNYQKIQSEPIGTADATLRTDIGSLMAEGEGDIVLISKVSQKQYKIILKDVFYVPGCRRNLMSVAQIEKRDKRFMFENGCVTIIDRRENKTIVQARRVNNLYVVLAEVGRTMRLFRYIKWTSMNQVYSMGDFVM